MMDIVQRFSTAIPAARTFADDRPTLIVSWWCTCYSITIIIFRVCGRYVRTEKIFIEDGLMLGALAFLLIRMGLVHAILLYGTNNTLVTGFSVNEVARRELGSKLVLASRIMYAAYLWTVKYSVSMFLRSLTEQAWLKKFHKRMLLGLHVFLAITFVATIIADFAECRPLDFYWAVTGDEGHTCRQAYGHAIVVGVSNVLTDLLLVAFPIPMLINSQLPRARKLGIAIPLALPLACVAVTSYRIPSVIERLGEQPFRTLIASVEILVSTMSANAVVLSSLLQDRGYKKMKYKPSNSNTRNLETSNGKKAMQSQWGSDEDLMHADDLKKQSSSVELKELTPLQQPVPAKLRVIAVESTWNIEISKEGTEEASAVTQGSSF